MEFQNIAVVSERPGLYNILRQSKAGLILESIDDKKHKFILNLQYKVTLLSDIAIYTTGEKETIPLIEIFREIYTQFEKKLTLEKNSEKEKLMAFIKQIVPNYDTEKVYPSTVIKIVNWYQTLCKYYTGDLLKLFTEEEKDN